jgi:hypothetical protein
MILAVWKFQEAIYTYAKSIYETTFSFHHLARNRKNALIVLFKEYAFGF